MTEQQTPTSEVLNKAADLIEERGWVQGGTGDATRNPWGATEDSPVCLEGAIAAVMGVEPGIAWEQNEVANLCPAGQAVRAYLEMPTKFDGSQVSLWAFNDAFDRTATEVIEVLRAAAAIEQAREAGLSGTGECELTAEAVR